MGGTSRIAPELGLVSQGETPEHAKEMIKEAVELWLECADESEIRRRLKQRKVAIKNPKPRLRVFSGA
jgi:predicted RNase H-like HicB family nuclease